MLTNQQKSRESAILFDCDFYPRTVNKTKISFNSEAVLTKAYILKLFQLGKRGIFNELIETLLRWL